MLLRELKEKEMKQLYDCGNEDGCGVCKVCEYLAFHEWVSSVRVGGDSVDRDPELDAYLLEKYNIRA